MDPRFFSLLNTAQFRKINNPIAVHEMPTLRMPAQDQMILRMCVQAPYSNGVQLPEPLEWLRSAIAALHRFQRQIVGIRHPYIYVTVRHGPMVTVNDDQWHVDGFSMRNHHLPDANYLYASEAPTQWLKQAFIVPQAFDPLKHNINLLFQRQADLDNAMQMAAKMFYFVDPYVVHRRPPDTNGKHRTFVRVSFTNLEICDVNNTQNPLINTSHYTRDGVKEFRDKLVDYYA